MTVLYAEVASCIGGGRCEEVRARIPGSVDFEEGTERFEVEAAAGTPFNECSQV